MIAYSTPGPNSLGQMQSYESRPRTNYLSPATHAKRRVTAAKCTRPRAKPTSGLTHVAEQPNLNKIVLPAIIQLPGDKKYTRYKIVGLTEQQGRCAIPRNTCKRSRRTSIPHLYKEDKFSPLGNIHSTFTHLTFPLSLPLLTLTPEVDRGEANGVFLS